MAGGVSASLSRPTVDTVCRFAPNLLNRNFAVAAPNQAWIGGTITYIPTHEGWLLLAVVIDLFEAVAWWGWSMQPEMRSNLVIDALQMAWFRRAPDKSTGRDLP